jgi:hypothetical protein
LVYGRWNIFLGKKIKKAGLKTEQARKVDYQSKWHYLFERMGCMDSFKEVKKQKKHTKNSSPISSVKKKRGKAGFH